MTATGWPRLRDTLIALFHGPLSEARPIWLSYVTRAYLLALLVHYGKRWTDPELTVLLLIFVVWTLLRPQQIAGFLIANAVVFINEIEWFPRIANHASLQVFIAVLTLVLAAYAVLRQQPVPWAAYANALRGMAIVLYFYVGFHKINVGFLDPVASCATWYHEKFMQSAFGYEGEIPYWIRVVSPWGVIVLELIACVLLIFPRTWLLGLIVAIPIHLYVSLSAFIDFSSMMHAIMLLFLPPAFWSFIARNDDARRLLERSFTFYAWSVLLIAVGRYYAQTHWGWSLGTMLTVQGVLYNLAVLELMAVIAYLLWRHPETRKAPVIGWPGWRRSHIVVPLLILIWGAFPYFFGSQGSLTMFSNLVTERARQNHLLIDTRWTKIVDFEADLVKVVWMSPNGMRDFRYDLEGFLIPRKELQNIARIWRERGKEPVAAALEERGRIVVYEDMARSDLGDYDWVARWFTFRQIDPTGIAQCRW